MKKALSILLILVMVAGVFIGCSDESSSFEATGATGSFRAVVGRETARTIHPDSEDIEVVRYKLVGYLDAANTVSQDFQDSSVKVDNLKVGTWTFYVLGYNADEKQVAVSEEQQVTIETAKESTATFQLAYDYTGEATVSLTIHIPATNDRITSLTFKEAKLAFEFTLDRSEEPIDGYYVFTKTATIPAGKWSVSMFDSTGGKGNYVYVAEEGLIAIAGLNSSFELYYDFSGTAGDPEISVDGDTVTIEAANETDEIYYSIGSDDIRSFEYYEGPFAIAENCTIYAFATGENLYRSAMVSEDCVVKVKTPTVSVAEGTYSEPQKVVLSCATPGASIYYTLNGNEPTSSDTLYQGQISIDRNTTLKAVAVKENMGNSDVVSRDYLIRTTVPTISSVDGQVTIMAAEGAAVYYTLDGSDPVESETRIAYSEPFTITETTTVKTVAILRGYTYSGTVTREIKVLPVLSDVSISPDAGTYAEGQQVTITSVSGATIHYSTNGVDFSIYEGPLTLNANITIYAYAEIEGYNPSNTISNAYLIQAAIPEASVEGGTYTEAKSVTLSTTTAGATIYYTVDGTTPTTASTAYEGSAIEITETTTIKAIAVKNGLVNSEVLEVVYQIDGLAGFTVLNPKELNSVSIIVPEEWGSGVPTVVPGVAAKLSASLQYPEENVTYQWYLNGSQCKDFYGMQNLLFGTVQYKNVYLEPGSYTITCVASAPSGIYSTDYKVKVSARSGAIGTRGESYFVGARGPAGGYIFYDKGNNDGGWRYLEAAPADITKDGETGFFFGFYRTEDNGDNLYVNGTTSYDASDCTGTAIGKGKTNTEKLVGAMKDAAYTRSSGTETTADYAAKLCADYSITENGKVYDDWFLPSKDELCELYKALKCEGGSSHGSWCPDKTHAATSTAEARDTFGYDDYWSSSEDGECGAWYQNFDYGIQNNYYLRSNFYRVRAVRAF